LEARRNGSLNLRGWEGFGISHGAMWNRRIGFGLVVVLLSGLGGGCKKSPPPAVPLLPPPVETVARFHWLGKQRLAAETNATFFLDLWNLPESKNLEQRTLDRLAIGWVAALTSSSVTNPSVVAVPPTTVASNHVAGASTQAPTAVSQPSSTNYSSQLTGLPALLRPLLQDLVQQESFADIRHVTNQPGDFALAIRLAEDRAQLWRTNLAALLESLTTGRAAPVAGRTNGWQLQFAQAATSSTNQPGSITRIVDFAQVGEWTIVGLATTRNELFGELQSLLREDPTGVAQAPKDFWLFAEVDLRRVVSALSLGWKVSAEWPTMTLGVNGDGQTVWTRGRFNFPKPLPFELQPWNIPTNLIQEPLVSFVAMQGLQSWLSAWPFLQALELGTAPNQLYFWSQRGPEFLSYVAAPMNDASNHVQRLAAHLMQKPNAYLATNGMGKFELATNGPGVVWSEVLLTAPFLKPVSLTGGEFVYGGLVPSPLTNRPPNAGLLRTVLGDTNLVAYSWEMSGLRLDQWLHFGQLFRFVLHLAQVPPESTSFTWLKALEPKLAGCVTAVTRTGPAQLSLVRRSSVGLSAAELDLLADWLESPQFPGGLHTFLGQPVPLPRSHPPRTGIVPAANPAPPAAR
jgi:hypothetical protein